VTAYGRAIAWKAIIEGAFPRSGVREIGFTSWFSRSMPLEVALRHLAAADCMDIELAAMPQYLRRSTYIRAALKKMGLNATAVSLGVPFFFSDSRLDLNSPKRSVREASLRYVRKSVDLASQLEADLIYACSMKRGAQAELGTALEHFRQAVAECSDYAKGAAVRFAIEPFPTGLLPTLRETNAFIREIAVRQPRSPSRHGPRCNIG
jgi:sugar phosphate isomerase/epimerase